MGVKALDIYQGEDWLTNRWSVAQAFDTLDRLRDLCSGQTWGYAAGLPEAESVLCGIGDLCDDLAAELAAVEADLQPFLRHNPPQRWQAFELRLYMGELRGLLEVAALEDGQRLIERVIHYCRHIKDSLKQLDL